MVRESSSAFCGSGAVARYAPKYDMQTLKSSFARIGGFLFGSLTVHVFTWRAAGSGAPGAARAAPPARRGGSRPRAPSRAGGRARSPACRRRSQGDRPGRELRPRAPAVADVEGSRLRPGERITLEEVVVLAAEHRVGTEVAEVTPSSPGSTQVTTVSVPFLGGYSAVTRVRYQEYLWPDPALGRQVVPAGQERCEQRRKPASPRLRGEALRARRVRRAGSAAPIGRA